ncbi:MAG: hemolysin III family protein [Reyranellaceae bacterium]
MSDAAVHAAGLVLGLGGAVVMIARLGAPLGSDRGLAVVVYIVGLMAMLGCSALYHLWRGCRRRDLLRRLDHAAIFLMIAGTYTPLVLVGLVEPWRGWLLAFVWTAAAIGIVLKLVQPHRVEAVSLALYLLLGWIGVVASQAFIAAFDTVTLTLIVLGGGIYSAGVAFHLSSRLPHRQALWHGSVLLAAIVHYLAILVVVGS